MSQALRTRSGVTGLENLTQQPRSFKMRGYHTHAIIMVSETSLSRLGLCLYATFLLQGCSLASLFSSEEREADMMPRDRLQVQREKGFQRTWRGRPFRDLVAYFGTPKIMMDVPGNRPLKTTVAVYGVVDRASDCIDAFTLVQVRRDELEVADYFCR